MKKNYILILIMFLTTFVYGQTHSDSFLSKIKNKSLDKQKIQRVINRQNSAKTSQLNVKQRLDSLLLKKDLGGAIFIVYKEVFSYDSVGNNTSSISYEFDNTSLSLDSKEEYAYDSYQRIIYNLSSEWDDVLNKWENDNRSNITYVSDTINTIYESWDDNNNKWEMSAKYVQIINTNNMPITTIDYYWNSSNNTWIAVSKKNYFYNSNNNIDSIITYSQNTTWKLDEKESHFYDANNNDIETIVYRWVNNAWENDYKTITKYDANNMHTSIVELDYINASNTWENDDSTHYSNLGDDINLYEDFNWDNKAWQKEEKDDFTHNAAYSYSDLILPNEYLDDDFTQYFSHMLSKLTIYEGKNNKWNLDVKANLYYSSMTINSLENNTKNNNISIYPNPSVNYLIIDNITNNNLNISVFDITGKKVLQQNIINNNKVDISALQSGVYFIQILKQNEVVYTDKFIKY